MRLYAIDERLQLEVEGAAIPVRRYKILSSAPNGAELEITIPINIRIMEAEIEAIQEPLLRQNLKAKSGVPLRR